MSDADESQDSSGADRAEVDQLVKKLAERLADSEKPEKSLPPEEEKLKDKEWRDDIRLKRLYGLVLPLVMVTQIAIADWIFYLYGSRHDWQIPVAAISSWLGAVVVQVVGIVVIIARHLFPSEQARPGR